ncbi:signal recognition particle-docking protein FtsY [Candidatus Woesearchaeota archaeon]|nr:signal recognition particle-docking protein FtsY [Candidatus Woesearchaeota archaeon]
MEQPPSPIEIEEPVKQVIEKKKEEIEVKPQKVDDELEELKQEGYHEISLEPPKRAVRIPEYVDEEQEEKRGFFAKIADVVTKTTLSEEKFEELFWELEVALMENNVAVEVIDKIKGDLKAVLVNKKIQRGKSLDIIRAALQHSIEDLFNVAGFDLVQAVRVKKPYIISFVGINGSGKTTTIAKIAHMLKMNNVSCIIAASDTFRAAAIQQLEEHAEKIGVKLIKHDYGADPAAVAFDAIKYAQAKSIDCVLIDTAGRLHSNTNLMDEMKKIIRIAKPDLKIFIGEAITGNDCIEQAKQFNKAIGIDGIILCKADVDDKGGAAISVSYVTGKPILYLGVGQRYADLLKFDKKLIMDTISF